MPFRGTSESWSELTEPHEAQKKGRKQLCREDLGILMGSKLNRTQQHDLVAIKAKGRLGCVSEKVASRLREGDFRLCSALLRLWTSVGERLKNWRTTEVVESGAHDIPGRAVRAGCVWAEKRLRGASIDSDYL